MDEITLRTLHNFNEHWEADKIPERLLKRTAIKRDIFNIVRKSLENRQIISITGLRRTGKTTLVFQLIEYLLAAGISQKNIMYFSFDEITAKNPEIIDELIRYHHIIMQKNLNDKERRFLFLDEIQKITDWQAIIKRYYDLGYNIKFIITGSESLLIRKKTKESLAGRNYEFLIYPLTFKEYLKFKGIEIKKTEYKEIYYELITTHDIITSLYREYLIKGAFPETVHLNINEAQEYIKSAVLDKIIFSDIPILYKITNPEILYKIIEIASKNSSGLFEINNVIEALNVSRNTASSYISYLENSFLIKFSYNYTKSKLRQLRTSKKIYITDTGIINAVLKQSNIESNEEMGRLAETQIFNFISRENSTFFWRDKKQNEIDIIVANNELFPIEVKYRNEINKKDLNAINLFAKKNKVKKSILITKSKLSEINKTKLIPAWLFQLK